MTDKAIPLYGEISPSAIRLHMASGRKVNPRGPIRDTTDLQQSIGKHGILQPLLVRLDAQGHLWLIDGERRLTAAKALGLPVVPYVVREAEGINIVDLMLATNLHEQFPDIVIDGAGTVVGGVAFAVAQRLAQGDTTIEGLARVMGLRPDLVSAYNHLTQAPVEIRQAVARGRLSMTAYARMKRAPEAVQVEIVQAASGQDGDGQVTLDRVRQGLRQSKGAIDGLASLVAAEAQATPDDLGPMVAALTARLLGAKADQVPPVTMVALQRLAQTIEKLASQPVDNEIAIC